MTAITKYRITSIDFLRGAIMIIMALDHVRDYLYFGSHYFDPLDFSHTNGALFFTRWITHFCAPIFMMLAGTSASLIGQKKTKKELSAFLVKRGLWLILLELVVVNFGWNFNIAFPMIFLITIWALGVSMIILAAFIHLPLKYTIIISVAIILGHDLLDSIQKYGNTLPVFEWSLLHEQYGFMWHKELILVGYPLVPLMAVMPLGYCLGAWFSKEYDSKKRQKNLLITGSICIIVFILLRWSNVYGDPVKWTVQKNGLFTFMSFLNVNKYPPSLLYLLMTLGVAFLFLGITEKVRGAVVNVVSIYGRVPMFYYLIHIYVIHLIAMISSAFISGQTWKAWIFTKPIWFSPDLKGYGFSLPVTYLWWIGIVVALYPLCKRYDA